MGCDIHIFLEKKDINGYWKSTTMPWGILPDDRHYAVFAFLFGVRGDPGMGGKFASRGIPEGVEFYVSHSVDFHSHSYIYLNEVKKIKKWPKEIEECYFQVFLENVWPRMCGFKEEKNHRMIVAFDN